MRTKKRAIGNHQRKRRRSSSRTFNWPRVAPVWTEEGAQHNKGRPYDRNQDSGTRTSLILRVLLPSLTVSYW